MTKFLIKIFKTMPLLLLPLLSVAQVPAAPVPFQNERYLMVGFAIFLMLVILVLGKVVRAFANVKIEKWGQKRKDASNIVPLIMLAAFIGLFSGNAFAAEEAAAVIKEPSWFVTIPADIIVLGIIIVVELIIIMILVKVQLDLIKEGKGKAVIVENAKENKWAKFFTRVNDTVAIEDEHTIDLQHDYDGIRELDNRIPKWWLYSFYATIFIGVIYVYRMFVSETLPDQITELHQANIAADIKMKEYLKDAANNVDEKTVTMMDAAGIEAGKNVYSTMGCGTCHGVAGEGNSVGPNLTDDHWLHKGSIKDIFYSVKYGWPEKGMKSWKDDMSPIQIAQVASYIKSLKGSNPPNAKEAQGELYKDDDASSESGSDKSDSTVANRDAKVAKL